MKKRDILKELYEKKISEDEVHDVFDKVLDKNPEEVYNLLCFTKVEATAFLHGVNFLNLGGKNGIYLCRNVVT